MPIPFLLIGIGAAAVGVGKSIKAGVDQHDANDTNKYAQDIVDSAKEMAEQARKRSNSAVTWLGETKISVLDESVKPFIAAFEQLHNIDLAESAGLQELGKFRIDKQSMDELREMQSMASSILGGAASGAVLGAATAFGAYGAAMTFGAASTGTAIGALSGAAATNATLAFLGGGSLAAGGLGIAGGTAVLGGLVAGPALAVLGFVAGAKASSNKDKAYANLAQAKEFREEMYTLVSACQGIRLRANLFTRVLLQLDSLFAPMVYELNHIIATVGTDYAAFTPEQKKTVAASLSLAGAIKSILDTPILNEDGSLTEESLAAAGAVRPLLDAENT